jgi:hypothetical protein
MAEELSPFFLLPMVGGGKEEGVIELPLYYQF